MKYAKMVNGTLCYHNKDNPLIFNGSTVVTSNSELLLLSGYKAVVYTPPSPPEGYQVSSFNWTETDTQYVQTWTYELIPEEVYENSIEERLEIVETAVSVNEETTNMLLDCILEMSEIVYA